MRFGQDLKWGSHSIYIDKKAALKVMGTKNKEPLTNSPFIRKFQYGHNQDSYWTYDHIIIQFEGVCDLLFLIFGDAYEYVFYFDHSSGHDQLTPDELNVSQMNKYFGGTQSKMRVTVIIDETYLGLYGHSEKLKPGDNQHMSF